MATPTSETGCEADVVRLRLKLAPGLPLQSADSDCLAVSESLVRVDAGFGEEPRL